MTAPLSRQWGLSMHNTAPAALTALVVTVLGLSSCSAPADEAVATCEKVIALSERYPSTIKQVEASSKVLPLTEEQLTNELTGMGWFKSMKLAELAQWSVSAEAIPLDSTVEFPSKDGEQASLLRAILDRAQSSPRPGVLETLIRYNMDNGRGVPERHLGQCRFLLSDIEPRTPLIPFDAAYSMESSRQQQFGPVGFPNKGANCCIPQFVLKTANYWTGTPTPPTVIMKDELDLMIAASSSQ